MGWVEGMAPTADDGGRLVFGNALYRLRHRNALSAATVSTVNSAEEEDDGLLLAEAHSPMRGVTPGQVLAIYTPAKCLDPTFSSTEKFGPWICLGGGPILRAGSSYWEQG